MSPDFERPIEVITTYIKHVVPGISVTRVGNSTMLRVRGSTKEIVLPLASDALSDLQEALTNGSLPVRYKNGIIRDMTLGALVVVGKEGMASDVEVSKLILEEELDWNRHVSLVTSFDAETGRKLYDGLKALTEVATELLQSEIPVPELERERDAMTQIIAWYEKTGHLNSRDVSGDHLSYLKAAALCWILELEDKKSATTSDRLRIAQSVRLFELLEQFWLSRPFDRINLPPISRDYISHRGTDRKGVSVAIPGPSLDIGPQLKKLDPRLEERWRGAWQALRSENPDKVSQAANSMVEVLDKVIGHICADRQLKDVLRERYPKQEKVILAQRATISALKESLHAVKHETIVQSVNTAQDLMHSAEGIIRTLLR